MAKGGVRDGGGGRNGGGMKVIESCEQDTPERKKRVNVQMPLPNEKRLSFPIIQIARAMTPHMIWTALSIVAALT